MPARPLVEQIAEIKRELTLRAQVYPAFIARGRLTSEDAVTQVERLEAALATLEWLHEHRDLIVDLGRQAMAIRRDPALQAVLTEFPDATVRATRPVQGAS